MDEIEASMAGSSGDSKMLWQINEDKYIDDPEKITYTFRINDEVSTSDSWRFAALYKINIKGVLFQYWCGFNGTELIITEGYANGKVKTVKEIWSENPVKEVRRRYYDKLKNDYYRHAGDITHSGIMTPNKWEIGKTRLKYPIIVQPNLGAPKCLCRYEGNEIIYSSKTGVRWSHLASFDDELGTFLSYIPFNVVLDGEMVSDGSQGKIPTVTSIYNICDFDTSQRIPYEQRWTMLNNSVKQYLKDGYKMTRFKIIDSYTVQNSEEILRYCAYFSSLGHEGIIIRKISCVQPCTDHDIDCSLYKSGKTNNILKYKDFKTDTGVVISTDIDGVILRCKYGDIAMKSLHQRELNSYVIGSKISYRYNSISLDGIPIGCTIA